MKAIIFAGGWGGHRPTAFAEWAKQLLTQEGFAVEISESLELLTAESKMQSFERAMITEAISRTDGNKSAAARILNITERHFISITHF